MTFRIVRIWGSSLGMGTRLLAGWVEARFQAWATDFFSLLQNAQIGYGAHVACCSLGFEGKMEGSWSWLLTRSRDEVQNEWSCASAPLYAFIVCTETVFATVTSLFCLCEYNDRPKSESQVFFSLLCSPYEPSLWQIFYICPQFPCPSESKLTFFNFCFQGMAPLV